MNEEGLGDKVEKVIKSIAPKIAKKLEEKDCGCKSRKEWLNNIGATFS